MKPVERWIRQYQFFAKREGTFVSSRDVMEVFGLADRKVVNQDVHLLQENGCKFKCTPGKGYKMISHCNLDEFALGVKDTEYKEALAIIREKVDDSKVRDFIDYALECIAYRRLSEGER